MQLHHVINSYSLLDGGAECLVRSMHLSMRERGIESKIYGLQAQEDEELEFAESLGLKSPYSVRAIFGIGAYIKKNVRPGDLVHAHLFPANLYVSLLKQLGFINVPVVTTEHSTSNSRRGTLIGRLIDRVLYRGFDRIFAISEGVKIGLTRWQPALSKQIVTVENGVQLLAEEFYDRGDSAIPIILSVGRLVEPKNYERMLSALALLADYEFEYWIAGDGESRAALEELVSQLDMGSKVQFLGYVGHTLPLLEQADIFLAAPLWEGFGLSVLEAMNASLPIVASKIDGLCDVVASEPPCAVLVDPNSPVSISKGVRELLLSSEKRKQLGRSGFERAKSFSEDRMINRYIQEYGEVRSYY
jgi:glycosyltransferase involved in cell wall biosynthesis